MVDIMAMRTKVEISLTYEQIQAVLIKHVRETVQRTMKNDTAAVVFLDGDGVLIDDQITCDVVFTPTTPQAVAAT
jgi:hypothetical protein